MRKRHQHEWVTAGRNTRVAALFVLLALPPYVYCPVKFAFLLNTQYGCSCPDGFHSACEHQASSACEGRGGEGRNGRSLGVWKQVATQELVTRNTTASATTSYADRAGGALPSPPPRPHPRPRLETIIRPSVTSLCLPLPATTAGVRLQVQQLIPP